MKVYHVEIKQAGGNQHYYFGSKIALAEFFVREDLGVGYSRLRNINLKEPYENSKCIIRLGELRRKETKRGSSRKLEG